MHLGKEHIVQKPRSLSVRAALNSRFIIADTRDLLTFNHMIARFTFTAVNMHVC